MLSLTLPGAPVRNRSRRTAGLVVPAGIEWKGGYRNNIDRCFIEWTDNTYCLLRNACPSITWKLCPICDVIVFHLCGAKNIIRVCLSKKKGITLMPEICRWIWQLARGFSTTAPSVLRCGPRSVYGFRTLQNGIWFSKTIKGVSPLCVQCPCPRQKLGDAREGTNMKHEGGLPGAIRN